MKQIAPQSKGGIASVARLKKVSLSEIVGNGAELLKWMQDFNWPVAQALAPILSQYTNDLKLPILNILRGNDDIWKYWIIERVLYYSEEKICTELLEQLEKIALNPTPSEVAEGVEEVCVETLKRWK